MIVKLVDKNTKIDQEQKMQSIMELALKADDLLR